MQCLFHFPEDSDGRVHGGDSDESDDGLGAPPAGNTEGDGIQMNKQQEKQARGGHDKINDGLIFNIIALIACNVNEKVSSKKIYGTKCAIHKI